MKKLSFNSIIRKQQPKCFYQGHLKILAPASQHHHRHWQWHCKKIIFSIRISFLKVEYLCSFLCLVMLSVPLCYKYLILYDFIKKGVHCCSIKKLFEHSEASVLLFKKKTAPNISAFFAYFPAKHPGLSSF